MAPDHRDDVVIYNSSLSTVYPLASNGDGTFSGSSFYASGYDVIKNGDFNSDGKMDILLYNSISAVTYLGIGNGDGTFAFHPLSFSPGYLVEVADMDGDGYADLILYNPSNGTTYIATKWSDVTLNFQSYVYTLWSSNYTRVVAADFNGDGVSDVLLYRAGDGATYLGINSTPQWGTFSSGSVTYYPQTFSAGYNFLQPADLNGDGRSDLIVYNSGTAAAWTLLSTGSGFQNGIGIGLSPAYTSVLVGDMTGDGIADLLVYASASGNVHVGVGNGNGTFNFTNAPSGPSPVVFWSRWCGYEGGPQVYSCPQNNGYLTKVNYTVSSMCGLDPAMSGYHVNEQFTGLYEFEPNYTNSNWTRIPGPGFIEVPPGYNSWADLIGKYNPNTVFGVDPASCDGVLCNPQFTIPGGGPHTLVQHIPQSWFVGSPELGSGARVQTNTLQKYTDSGWHTDIITPHP